MNNLEQFKRFTKNKATNTTDSDNNYAVIYTRVSTKEQAENNQSLTVQKKVCEEFAKSKSFRIVEYFGGTHESAKNDERAQFQQMLKYARSKKVANIIIYSIDRFSRSGPEAVKIMEDLRKVGIYVWPVMQQIDPKSNSGALHQLFLLGFSHFDNQERRDKTMAGTKERLEQGYWVTKAPLGFSHTRKNGEQHIVVNDTGRLIQKAFLMKANEGLSNVQIVERLRKLGLKIYKQKLSEIFSNVFYCGLISHQMLGDKIVQGKQETLISQDIFLKVNSLQSKNNSGYKHKQTDEALPLKRFVKCAKCGTTMTGYEVKSKGKHYYKCNKKGCGSNKSANHMHAKFYQLLSSFEIEDRAVAPLRDSIKKLLKSVSEQQQEERKDFKKAIKELEQKIENAQERLFNGSIPPEVYNKFIRKYEQELEEIKAESSKEALELSNLEKSIDLALSISVNISESWVLGDFHTKQLLQKMLFEEGIAYNTEKDDYRTDRTNPVFTLIHTMSSIYSAKNKRPTSKKANRSYLVAGTRLELVTFGL
ncbi:recombinase family protein [Pontibacter sp. MBLB2868]|uniref:recombinase family protein n=1 Tax=Pontibacter sp. MBLB2868 TaxID=3451555 RepID=UPI003F75058E